MRVLVTGGTSLLGAAVAQRLVERGDDVVTLQRGDGLRALGEQVRGDIRDADAVSRAVRGADAVVHLAAKVSVTGAWDEFESINVGGTAERRWTPCAHARCPAPRARVVAVGRPRR